VPFRGSERILWNYIIHKKFPQDVVKAKVYRAGKKLEVDIVLCLLSHLVPPHLYDTRPRFVCFVLFASFFPKENAHSNVFFIRDFCLRWGIKYDYT